MFIGANAITATIVALFVAPAWAYVDPGTGSVVFGGLAYLLVIGGAALAFVFRPVRNIFKRIFNKKGE